MSASRQRRRAGWRRTMAVALDRREGPAHYLSAEIKRLLRLFDFDRDDPDYRNAILYPDYSAFHSYQPRLPAVSSSTKGRGLLQASLHAGLLGRHVPEIGPEVSPRLAELSLEIWSRALALRTAGRVTWRTVDAVETRIRNTLGWPGRT